MSRATADPYGLHREETRPATVEQRRHIRDLENRLGNRKRADLRGYTMVNATAYIQGLRRQLRKRRPMRQS